MYALITWDHGDEVPIAEINEAIAQGFHYFQSVPDTGSDTVAAVGGKTPDFSAQEVWDEATWDEANFAALHFADSEETVAGVPKSDLYKPLDG